jgi:hypothetical protein
MLMVFELSMVFVMVTGLLMVTFLDASIALLIVTGLFTTTDLLIVMGL